MRMIIFYLALLYYANTDADSQTKSNNYLLKNHESSKISRKKARKYDKHGLSNFTDYSFASKTETSNSEVHAGKDGKKEEKEKKNDTGKDDLKGKQEEHAVPEGGVKQAVQEKNGEKKPSNEEKSKKESKDDAEEDDNVDEEGEDDSDGEDDEEDGEPKINSKKEKGILKEDKKGGDNKEKKKQTKGDFDDDENSEEDEADDENEGDDDDEDDEEEETGKKPSQKKNIGKQQKESNKNGDKGKKEINAHGGHENKHEDHHGAPTVGKHQGDNNDKQHGQKTHNTTHEKQQSGKEANNNNASHNNPEVKTNAPNLNNIEQKQPTSPPPSNVAQKVVPTVNAFVPKKQDPISPYNNNVKINEDIHIPDDIKKDFMKLLRSVVQLNIKEALHQGNNHHPHGDQQKNSSGMPPTYMNAPHGNGTKNTSFLNKLTDHFKKYMMYYLGGLVVLSAFVLAMQCSDVSDKKRKNPAKRDRTKITNYRRDIES